MMMITMMTVASAPCPQLCRDYRGCVAASAAAADSSACASAGAGAGAAAAGAAAVAVASNTRPRHFCCHPWWSRRHEA